MIDDWSFSELSRAETLWGPHGYHRYPAKFIPQLVRRLIDDYSAEGELVGDPFVGSATTGVEALRSGRRFWGADINPVAVLISRAKCEPIEPKRLHQAWTELDGRLDTLPCVGRRALTREEKSLIAGIDIARASGDERLRYWFPTAYRDSLQCLLDVTRELRGSSVKTFFLCAFSNILRRCSIWLSGSTKPQKDLEKALNDPVESFRLQARDMIRRNQLYWDDLIRAGIKPADLSRDFKIVAKDARALPLADGSLDLLVSSPPYATCYEYTEIHQLTQLWFEGQGVLTSRRWQHDCIGSRHTSARTLEQESRESTTGSIVADKALARLEALSNGPAGSNARREAMALRYYFRDMQTILREFARVVRINKCMVLVIGDSRKRGVNIPTSAAICELAVSLGFELERKIVRKIPARVLVMTRDEKTGRFSSVASSNAQAYPEEDILVLRRKRTTPS